jgi:hypothetical protein
MILSILYHLITVLSQTQNTFIDKFMFLRPIYISILSHESSRNFSIFDNDYRSYLLKNDFYNGGKSILIMLTAHLKEEFMSFLVNGNNNKYNLLENYHWLI